MSFSNLKLLDVNALLKRMSEDEYDSDVTMIDDEIKGVSHDIKRLEQSQENMHFTVGEFPFELDSESGMNVIFSSSNGTSYNKNKTEDDLKNENTNEFSENIINQNESCSENNFSLVSDEVCALADMPLDCIDRAVRASFEYGMKEAEAQHWISAPDQNYVYIVNQEEESTLNNDQPWNIPDSTNQIVMATEGQGWNNEYSTNQIVKATEQQGWNNDYSTNQIVKATEQQGWNNDYSTNQIVKATEGQGWNNEYSTNQIVKATEGQGWNNDYSTNQTSQIYIPVENSSENYPLGISTESLVDILGINCSENFSASKGGVCTPPLTLVEKVGKKSIASKRLTSKKEKCIEKRIIPKRKCQSKSIEDATLLNMNKEPWKSNEANHVASSKNLGCKTNDACLKKGGKKYRKGKSKSAGEKPSSNAILRGSLVQTLKEMEQTLHQTEQVTYRWVNGEGENVSREKAFEMLRETQGIEKVLESLKVPRRSYIKFNEVRESLCKRASKLAFAIDAAIAESDQMFRREIVARIDTKSDECSQASTGVTDELEIKKKTIQRIQQVNVFGNNSKQNTSFSRSVERTFDFSNDNFPSKLKSLENLSVPPRSLSRLSQESSKENVKPIFKNSCLKSSKGNSHNKKHITFSDEVELYFPSDTSYSSSSTDQSSSQACMNENDSAESINENHNDTIHSEQTFEFRNNCCQKLQTLCLEPENQQTTGVTDSATDGNSHKQPDPAPTPLNVDLEEHNIDASFNTDSMQLEPENMDDVVASGTKGDSEEHPEKHSVPCSSLSEGLSEGFGFTEEAERDQQFWGNVSIADIKYIRVKRPGEFYDVEDFTSLDDLDSWY